MDLLDSDNKLLGCRLNINEPSQIMWWVDVVDVALSCCSQMVYVGQTRSACMRDKGSQHCAVFTQ